MNPSNSHCVVSGSLALLLRAARAVGLAPLSLTRAHAAWRVTPSPSLATLQRFLMTVFNIAILAGLGWDFCQDPDKRIRLGDSTLKAVVWICDMLLMMATASMAVYTGPSRMENLIQVVNELQQINYDLKIKPPSVKSEKLRSAVLTCILIWTTALQLSDIYDLTQRAYTQNKKWPIMGLMTPYFYGNLVQVVTELQWYYNVRAVCDASAELNQQLLQLCHANFKSERTATLDDLFTAQSFYTLANGLTSRTTYADTPIYPSHAQATIRRLALSYDRLSEVVAQLNADGGPILLLTIMSYALRLVLSPYYLLLNLCGTLTMSYVVLQVCWIVHQFMNLVFIVEPCHWAQRQRGILLLSYIPYDQREHTEHVLSQLTVHLAPKCERISKELDQFAKQVTLNKAKFTPLGIFTLSRPVIATILGSVTTYLIILIQFRKLSDLL